VFTTAVAVLAGVALLVPGFVVAELAATGRARTKGSDLELALRALIYALLIHLVFAAWTVDLAREVGAVDEWLDHAGALVLYGAVVLLAVPALVGSGLNVYLRWAEAQPDPLPLLAAIFGGRDARDAFDYAMCRLENGGYVIVELKGLTPQGNPRYVGGMWGESSFAGISPLPHNLYLQQEWAVGPATATAPPNLTGPIVPTRGVLIAGDEIAKVHVLPTG
jgi:hypothetical protein